MAFTIAAIRAKECPCHSKTLRNRPFEGSWLKALQSLIPLNFDRLPRPYFRVFYSETDFGAKKPCFWCFYKRLIVKTLQNLAITDSGKQNNFMPKRNNLKPDFSLAKRRLAKIKWRVMKLFPQFADLIPHFRLFKIQFSDLGGYFHSISPYFAVLKWQVVLGVFS